MAESNKQLVDQLASLQNEHQDLKRQMKSSESERLLLLKSRGITPKCLPLWALSENPREGVKEIVDKIKFWTGTWNLGSSEPFAGMDKARAQRLLQPFIPPGYDLYVLGVQECISDSIFECLDGLLVAEGCRRLSLDGSTGPLSNATPNSAQNNAGQDMSKLLGRGDGSLLSLKFTGIVVYVRLNLFADTRVLSVTNFPFTAVHSKGAVAAVISVFGRNLLFINCHLEAKENEIRREQYQKLIIALGAQLGETGYHLQEQFHHVIWFGDLNYRLVDTSGNRMPVDTATKLLEDGRLFRTLFETHDQLNQEKKNQLVFFGFREPTPFPNFYPSYKKLENRAPVDYTKPSWVKNTYRTHYKEPFYKGGKLKERTPGFTDRVLYHSMADLVEDLLPESVNVDMNVYVKNTGNKNNNVSSNSLNSFGDSTDEEGRDVPKSLAVAIDNYRSVNDGEGLISSDHSPVYATFVLKVRHDYEKLIRESLSKKSLGNINTVFSALSSVEQRAEASSSFVTPSSTPTKSRPVGGGDESTTPSLLTLSLNNADNAQDEEPSDDRFNTKIYKYSLLPHGVYRIRISEMKLVWGTNEETPRGVSLLFPAPYEAEAGERFVGFHSETAVDAATASAAAGSMSYSLPSLETGMSPARQGMHVPASPANRNSQQRQSGKLNKFNSEAFDSSRLNNLAALVADDNSISWRKVGPSKTGTCLALEASGAPLASSNTKVRSATTGPSGKITPLQLIWRGDEPLDKLHISLKASVPLAGISSTTVRHNPRHSSGGAGSSSTSAGDLPSSADDEDCIEGHCAIGLEQLCKVAMVSSGGTSGYITVSRLLVNRGRPMYNMDPRTMQREMVTLTCTLELMPNI
eukprot:gene21629-27668_t